MEKIRVKRPSKSQGKMRERWYIWSFERRTFLNISNEEKKFRFFNQINVKFF